ncbi:MAG: O-antigen ligase family protein [Terriglobia bacterium]
MGGTFFWVLVFFVVYCARPEDWIPGVAHLRPAMLVGVAAVVAFGLNVGRLERGLPKETLLLVLLIVQMGLASLFSPVWKGGAFTTTLGFAKVVLIIVVMAMAVTSLARLRKLIFVQSACVAVIAIISLKESHLANGRLEGGLNGIYQNPNDLAIAMVLTLPFCLVFLFRGSGGVRKAGWALASLLMAYTVFRTGSRAGLIALVIMGALCLWEFGVKEGRSYLLVVAVLALAIMFVFAGREVIQRFSNTSQYEGNEAAYQSAQQRRQLLIKSLRVTLEHPLFGIGPGNFPIYSGVWRETHNVYTEFSAEGGIPALVLFLMIYWCAFKNIREVKERSPAQSETAMLANAARAGLAAFALVAFFYPDAYEFFLYFAFAYTTALRQIVLRGEPLEAPPVDPAKERKAANWVAAPASTGRNALPVNLQGSTSLGN